MPRAFLITRRRYDGAEEEFGSARGYSPERGVQIADYSGSHSTSDGASECGSETSSECPEELYNLTKLAEVSLAAAAGTLIHPGRVLYQRPVSPRCVQLPEKCPRVPSRTKVITSGHHQSQTFAENESLANRTRFFLERIETESEVVENPAERDLLEVRLPSHYHRHLPHHQPDESHLRLTPVPAFENARIESPAPISIVSHGKRIGTVSTEASKLEDNEDHECPDCGKKYSTSSNLARHRQTHRSLGDKKARRCPHCDKVYVSMPAFSMHVRTHNQGCKCHYCGKCFSRPWLLQGHIRTHTGEKPFKCTICNKAFADKSNLRAHIQTHSNTKPHVCGRCGKAFALKSYLYKHEESSCMRAHHRSHADKMDEPKTPVKPVTASKTPTANTCEPVNAITVPSTLTASPTSVIVPRLGPARDQKSAFSAIIRHTRTSDVTNDENDAKRVCRERSCNEKDERARSNGIIDGAKDRDDLSSVAIRASVISPNPEHLNRLTNDRRNYDLQDTRPNTFITNPGLNLAIT